LTGAVPQPTLTHFAAATDSAFAWVNSRLFIGSGVRTPDSVRLEFFAVD
jgi:hypothetical protein